MNSRALYWSNWMELHFAVLRLNAYRRGLQSPGWTARSSAAPTTSKEEGKA